MDLTEQRAYHALYMRYWTHRRLSSMTEAERAAWVEKERLRKKAWRDKNREAHRARQRTDKIRAVKAASRATRRAAERKANVKWADKKLMRLFYKIAKDETKRVGRPVEVDHIVPIRSKLVCGLHCEQNLQLVTRHQNIKKRNSYWPDMPSRTQT